VLLRQNTPVHLEGARDVDFVDVTTGEIS
jgi:hypothetical protein